MTIPLIPHDEKAEHSQSRAHEQQVSDLLNSLMRHLRLIKTAGQNFDLGYTPGVPADWPPPLPITVWQALDELAQGWMTARSTMMFGPGRDGEDGRDGMSIPGKDGRDGSSGLPGVPGIDGEDGFSPSPIPGKDGRDGVGWQGPPGLDGEDGFSPSPIPGRDGTSGANGLDGATGRDGMFGRDGEDGLDAPWIPGTAGRDGVAGWQGPPGMDGEDGFSPPPIPGRDGINGLDGARGFDGRMGMDGLDGDDGHTIPGLRGDPGSAGLPGPPGIDGEDGSFVPFVLPFGGALKTSFSAVKGADQTGIASATVTKITFTTENYDSGNYYDAVNSKWTPPAGDLFIVGTMSWGTGIVAGAQSQIRIHKNGTVVAISSHDASVANDDAEVIAYQDKCNGTDFYEVYGYAAGAGNKSVYAGNIFQGWVV